MDTEEIDTLMGYFQAYSEAKQERDAARADCDHSWGHWGYYLEKQLESAKKSLAENFQAVITRAVERCLAPKE